MSHSLLWTLTPLEGQSSWLFGTMHIRDDRAYQLCSSLYPLIMEADAFVGEMDLNRQAMKADFTRYEIRDYFREYSYQKLRSQIQKSFQLDLDQYSQLHPLMIMSVISTSVLQSEHSVSLDEHLWHYALDQGKEVSGLESYEEQMKILHSIDPVPLYKQLLKIGRNPSAIRKHTARGINLFIKGDIHQLYMLSKSSLQNLRKKVIYERNIEMVSVIENLEKAKKYFITVGAGHLSGKYGLISLLKKKGISLQPVKEFSVT